MSNHRRALPRITSAAILAAALVACAHAAPDRGPRVVTTIPTSRLAFADSLESRPVTEVLPSYPYAMEAQGLSASIFTFVIVDTAGRVDVSSARFGREAPKSVYEAICRVLPRMRFAPIRRDGQARPALVVLQNSFMTGDETTAHHKLLSEAGLIRQMIRNEEMDSTLATLARQPRC